MGSDNPVQMIRDRIRQAAERSGRSADEITLVAVSKQKPVEAIITAYEAGIRHFGENRAGELEEKAQALSHLTDLKWHFIGHLQSKQSKPVVQYAHYFHALDRLKIARQLSKQLADSDRILPVFIQINASGEASKGGFACDNWEQDEQQINTLIQAVTEIAALPNLQLKGLMTMAPYDAPEEILRPIFRRMADLSAHLRKSMPEVTAQQLSMGMSGDFEIAIEEGASHVRIGSAIFGARAR